MRVRSLVAAILMSGLMSTNQVQAQQAQPTQNQPAQQAARLVGVIDVGHILQNHPTLKTKMEAIKTQMEAADKEMQARRDAIVKQMEQLKERYNEGTPEYDKAEKAIADQDTSFRLELVRKRKEFETAQAAILFEVHSQMTKLLEHLSNTAGFQVILQVSRQPVDAKKPETLDMAMSQNVLYFNKNVDVTDWVLKALESAVNVPTNNAQPANRIGSAPGGVQPR
jgi:Skp family chaperone for outer membrane proteins